MIRHAATFVLLVSAASALAQEAVITRDGDWHVVTYADGGVLRYLPPEVTEADYPKRALRNGWEGRTVVQLHVNRRGRVTSCRVAESAGLAELDERACRIYRERGRFELTNLPGGKDVRAPVRWQLVD